MLSLRLTLTHAKHVRIYHTRILIAQHATKDLICMLTMRVKYKMTTTRPTIRQMCKNIGDKYLKLRPL
jgi:hypothetical protein